MKENITAFEGTLHKLTVNVSGVEDFSDYLVYGAAQPYGCSKCAHFEVVTKTEGTCEMIIPALSCGIYKYQLFIKRISTNQEFLILEGEINVKDRLCDCSAVTSNDETATVVDATFSADTVEVNVSIQEGAEGKPGKDGEPGPQGPEGKPGKDGTGGGSVDIQESKKRALEQFYGVVLDGIDWVAYNALGGVTACSDNLVPTSLTNCDIENLNVDGLTLNAYSTGFLGKSLNDFQLQSYSQSYDPDNPSLYYAHVYFNSMPNLVKFKQYDVEEENTIDLNKIDLGYSGTSYVGAINFDGNSSLLNVKVISDNKKLKDASGMFRDCTSLETVDVDFSEVRGINYCFQNCKKLQSFTLSNDYVDDLTYTFEVCKSLKDVTIDAPEVRTAPQAFRDCESLVSATLNLPNLTVADSLFANCKSLIDLPDLDYSKLISAQYLFQGCESLTSAPELLMIPTAPQVFYNCKSLESVNISFPNTTTIYNAFSNCISLKDATVSIPKVTNIGSLFSGCENIESITLETGNVYDAGSAFSGCKKLKTIPTFNISTNGCQGYNMCAKCESLESFNNDISKFTSIYSAFNGCKKLKEFSSSLASATSVSNMFYECVLDANSVKSIFNSIKTENNYSGSLDFSGFGVSPSIYTDEEIISLLGITDSNNLSSFRFTTTNNAGQSVYASITPCYYGTVFEEDLSELKASYGLFYGNKNIVEFKSDIPTVINGTEMFGFCDNLETFNSNASSLTNGYRMFYSCKKLNNLQANFDNLENGETMFSQCPKVKEWNLPLNKLQNGINMFSYTGITEWKTDLPALTAGTDMFAHCPLRSFEGDLSSLKSANYMFAYTGLESFKSALPALTSWSCIFEGCKLDADSVRNILTSLSSKSSYDEFRMGIKRSAVQTFEEITGWTPNSTTSYVYLGSYRGKRLYVRITSED